MLAFVFERLSCVLNGEVAMLHRFYKMLKEKETLIFLFIMGCLLFNWPFSGIFLERSLLTGLKSLFIVWGILILILFLISRSFASTLPKENDQTQKDR